MAKETRKWDYSFDQATGVFYKVDVLTGEIIDEGTYKPVFNRDRIITAEQQEAWDNYKKKQEQKAKRRDISKKNGGHYFVPRLQVFPDLKPQTATRLIYLMTYADYSEHGGRLRRTLKTVMHKDDLPNVLGLSKDAVKDFIEEVCPAYMEVAEDGTITIGEKAYHRGKVPSGRSYHRFYDHWVRSLYIATPKTKHKHLGYLFQMLPYISIEFNTLCFNPEETESRKIEYMRFGEFCDKIDFDKSHMSRLLKIYRDLRFEVKDESGTYTERFVSIVHDGVDHGNAKVFVNPRILYDGAHPEQVELLAGFSKD